MRPTPCSSHPCKNGGTCACDNGKDYVCKCAHGYGGKNCERKYSTDMPWIIEIFCKISKSQSKGNIHNVPENLLYLGYECLTRDWMFIQRSIRNAFSYHCLYFILEQNDTVIIAFNIFL